MNGQVLRVAWYRFRATFRRRWGGYLTLALLIGLVGGMAMGSMIAARRTDASYPAFLAGTNRSDLLVQPFTRPAYSPGFVSQLARLPHVTGVAVAVPFTAATLTPRGKLGTVLLAHVQLAASVARPHGLYSDQDRVTIVRGRRANPARPDEVVASPDAAALLRLHVGSRVRVGLISSTQQGAGIPASRRVDLTVVGIGVFNTQVLQDGIDSGRTGFLLGTPALAREFASCCASGMNVGLRLDGGSRYDTAVGQEYQHLVATSSHVSASGSELYVYVTSAIEGEAQRAIRPEAIALGVFAVIAGLAALIIGTQSISRQLRAAAYDTGVLRALGAEPTAIMADGLVGLGAAVVAGSLLAAAAAEPGRGRTAVPTRSVMAGAVLAMTVVTATLTFGASLTTLVSHPALYGWNFSYAFYAVQGWGPVPARWAGPLLGRDRLVAATTGVYFPTVQVNGQTVPAMVAPTRPAVGPHVLSGHGLDGSHEVVVGPATLAQLHQRVGGFLTVSSGRFHVRLRIAGTATMPTIGGVLSVHPTMDTGVLFSTAVLPAGAFSIFGPLAAGPNAILVRLRPGVSQAAGLRSLQVIGRQLTEALNSPRVLATSGGGSWADTIDLLPAQRPAEIVNYRTMGAMPAVLSGGLAAGAVAGLGLTLVASVRRRRRDFALLKTLGFTRRQLAGAVAWQSTVIAAAGLVAGVPLGIAAGRWLWLAFARQLSAVPDPVVPATSIALAAVVALLLANAVAALPGRRAALTPPAAILRAE